jgi:hypothetical protein
MYAGLVFAASALPAQPLCCAPLADCTAVRSLDCPAARWFTNGSMTRDVLAYHLATHASPLMPGHCPDRVLFLTASLVVMGSH